MLDKIRSWFSFDVYANNKHCFKSDDLIDILESLESTGKIPDLYTAENKLTTYMFIEKDIQEFNTKLEEFINHIKGTVDISHLQVKKIKESLIPDITLIKWISPDNKINPTFKEDVETFIKLSLDLVLWYEMAKSDFNKANNMSASRKIKPYIINIDTIIRLIYLGI